MLRQSYPSPSGNVREEMALHLERIRLSGLTQLEYCRMNKLSYAKLVYWMRKARNQKFAR
ncbi:hypothetical protein BEL04_17535 [Mucilaginibacter sp. PPCGB 2223]|uniref:IS66 family insertion sequence element accessory protein TnpA n=1 Tax=Mucilaginibacter sp. PPCGB 2223 TaxID=1886027 RepID=UPI0008253A66|nr:hypothetical protein [Mucilaginibacter sp. PPCGB 2223]OCX51814.1 hypothetical protein BEL04_17535 [Mucilaginibacter sp. PPCGB 2223]